MLLGVSNRNYYRKAFNPICICFKLANWLLSICSFLVSVNIVHAEKFGNFIYEKIHSMSAS